jgi:hypothetical protein
MPEETISPHPNGPLHCLSSLGICFPLSHNVTGCSKRVRRFSLYSVTFVWISLTNKPCTSWSLKATYFVVITRRLGFSDQFIDA